MHLSWQPIASYKHHFLFIWDNVTPTKYCLSEISLIGFLTNVPQTGIIRSINQNFSRCICRANDVILTHRSNWDEMTHNDHDHALNENQLRKTPMNHNIKLKLDHISTTTNTGTWKPSKYILCMEWVEFNNKMLNRLHSTPHSHCWNYRTQFWNEEKLVYTQSMKIIQKQTMTTVFVCKPFWCYQSF